MLVVLALLTVRGAAALLESWWMSADVIVAGCCFLPRVEVEGGGAMDFEVGFDVVGRDEVEWGWGWETRVERREVAATAAAFAVVVEEEPVRLGFRGEAI